DLLQREVENYELGAVRQRRNDAVERLEAELEQVEREVVADAIEVGVAVLPVAVDQEDAILVFREADCEFLREGLVLPVSLTAIALRNLGRERHDAVQHPPLLAQWNGWRRTMVSARSAPVEIMSTGTPHSACRRSRYARARAGSLSYVFTPTVLSFH